MVCSRVLCYNMVVNQCVVSIERDASSKAVGHPGTGHKASIHRRVVSNTVINKHRITVNSLQHSGGNISLNMGATAAGIIQCIGEEAHIDNRCHNGLTRSTHTDIVYIPSIG